MYIRCRTIKDRKKKEHPLRLRHYGPHLRFEAILSGKKPKQLTNVSTALYPEDVGPALEKCRQRLAEVCDDQTEIDRLLVEIEARLLKQVEVTIQARENYHQELEAGAIDFPGASHLRLRLTDGAQSAASDGAKPRKRGE